MTLKRRNKQIIFILPLLLLAVFLAGLLSSPQKNDLYADTLAAGDVDMSFGGFTQNGRVAYNDMELLEFASYLDQGWVVLGFQSNKLFVRRYSYDGQLDLNFGQQGTATFVTNGNPCLAGDGGQCGIAVQSNGKIVVVGATRVGGDKDYLVYRLHPNGVLDTGFGQNGSRTIDFQGQDDQAYAVAIQKDHKIIVVGSATDVDLLGPDDLEFGTVRLTSGGDLDSSFNSGGIATASFGSGYLGQGSHIATSVAIQSDGRIVVAGQADDGSEFLASGVDYDFGVVRYKPDGTLDTSFSGDGKIKTGFDEQEAAYAIFIQPDGKIVVGGIKAQINTQSPRIVLARYHINGSLDNSFSGNGKVTTDVGYSKTIARAIVGRPDGKLLVLGSGENETFLVQYTPDGSLDTSFSSDGVRQILASQQGRDLALQSDGKILVGSTGRLGRYMSNLTLDRAGANTTNFGYGHERGRAIARMADGSYLVAAEIKSILISHGLDVALVKYTSSGQLDRSFGQNGRSAVEVINDDNARDMVVLPNGKIIVAGFRHQTINNDFALWQFNADGSPDGSFGSSGFALTGFRIGQDYGQEVVVQPDGKIVIAGFSENNSGRYLTMARFKANGQLDTTFATNGKFVKAQGQNYFSLRALEQLPNGDLLAVGGKEGDFWAYRFTADGVPVVSFGNNGFKKYALSGNDEAQTIGVLPNGLIVIGGYSGSDFGLLFIHGDGSMCLAACNFFDESRIRIDFGGDEVAYDMVIQSNGRIILAGSARDLSTSSSGFLLTRVMRTTFPIPGYNVDTSFGTSGQVAVPFLGGARPFDVELVGDKIVLTGLAQNGADDDIALVRLINDHREPLPPPSSFDVFLPFTSKP